MQSRLQCIIETLIILEIPIGLWSAFNAIAYSLLLKAWLEEL